MIPTRARFLDRFVDATLAAATNGTPRMRPTTTRWRRRAHVHERDRFAVARKQSRLRTIFPGREARGQGPAVVVLAQWNARWEEQQDVCRWLNKLGMTARQDEPAVPRSPRDSGPSARRPSGWPEHRADACRRTGRRWWTCGARCDGSSSRATTGWESWARALVRRLAFITMCHEPALRAGAFLHVATYFGDVVATGLTT